MTRRGLLLSAFSWPDFGELQLKMKPSEDMLRIAEFIVTKEGRFDADGRLVVYKLPRGDGGGSYEVAGINDKFHPGMARHLRGLIEGGNHEEAMTQATCYIAEYVGSAASYHESYAVDVFLMDCSFNRGPTGAVKILQQALKTAGLYGGKIDGKAGPLVQDALLRISGEDLIFRLLLSRQWYERCIVGRSESNPLWNGLVNRWINVAQFAVRLGNPYKNLA